MMRDGKCNILPDTYKKISNAKIRKNLIFNFDFASMISNKKENNRDKIMEITIFKKKDPTDKKEKVSPATRKLKTRIPMMSENEASYTRNSFFCGDNV
jgi:hypothetical protein